MDVKFIKTCLTFIPWENTLWRLAPYLIPNIYIFQKRITIIDLENKMWGHGISTLKSPKIVVTSIIFCISNFRQDVYNKLDENIVNFGDIWKVWNWTYSILLLKFTEDEDFVCDEHILTKIIPVREYEKGEIYFKSEVT